MKYLLTKWKFENAWLLYSLFGIALNVSVGISTIPHFIQIIKDVDKMTLVYLFLAGTGWGIGRATFGMGTKYLGGALTFAIVASETSAIGSLIPLVVYHRSSIPTIGGTLIFIAVGLIFCGLVVITVAANRKEARKRQIQSEREMHTNNDFTPLLQNSNHPKPITSTMDANHIKIGITISVISGCLSPLMNISLDIGSDLVKEAQALGASNMNSNNVVWTLSLTAGFIVNALYCVFLLSVNKTWHHFVDRSIPLALCWGLSGWMGICWIGSVIVYGMGATMMGDLGNVIGWALFIISLILSSQFVGVFVAKDWKGAGRKNFAIFSAGISVIIFALITLACGNFYQTTPL
eukprot:TRINITY_DN4807_c0_g2_i1.p1 TRINITY_DN4807_c0_g2~~TRINITY_DN4807_c0_g2_i1.p1  ORF type:complete len:349 (-),score=61.19 TRINITY_DN4807_c0_g2_i1:946-1992(-)